MARSGSPDRDDGDLETIDALAESDSPEKSIDRHAGLDRARSTRSTQWPLLLIVIALAVATAGTSMAMTRQSVERERRATDALAAEVRSLRDELRTMGSTPPTTRPSPLEEQRVRLVNPCPVTLGVVLFDETETALWKGDLLPGMNRLDVDGFGMNGEWSVQLRSVEGFPLFQLGAWAEAPTAVIPALSCPRDG